MTYIISPHFPANQCFGFANIFSKKWQKILPLNMSQRIPLENARKILYPHVVELVVEPARVADGLAVGVAPPQRRGRRLAVGARRAFASRRRLKRQQFLVKHVLLLTYLLCTNALKNIHPTEVVLFPSSHCNYNYVQIAILRLSMLMVVFFLA
jgi:hypothetical protein